MLFSPRWNGSRKYSSTIPTSYYIRRRKKKLKTGEIPRKCFTRLPVILGKEPTVAYNGKATEILEIVHCLNIYSLERSSANNALI